MIGDHSDQFLFVAMGCLGRRVFSAVWFCQDKGQISRHARGTAHDVANESKHQATAKNELGPNDANDTTNEAKK